MRERVNALTMQESRSQTVLRGLFFSIPTGLIGALMGASATHSIIGVVLFGIGVGLIGGIIGSGYWDNYSGDSI